MPELYRPASEEVAVPTPVLESRILAASRSRTSLPRDDDRDATNLNLTELRDLDTQQEEVVFSTETLGESHGHHGNDGDAAGADDDEVAVVKREARKEKLLMALRKRKEVLGDDAGRRDEKDDILATATLEEGVPSHQVVAKPYKSKTGVGRKRRSKLYIQIRNWMVNEGEIIFNILNFALTFNYYWTSPDYVTFRYYCSYGLPIARGAAANLNVSAGILLFPVCRNIISTLRNTFLAQIIPFDRNIDFHRILAFTTCFWTLVHATAHSFNFINYAKANFYVPTAETLALTSGPGATGQLMVLCLFLITTSSVAAVRRKYFETFWLTHHLGVLFYAILLFHGCFCFIKADAQPACRGPNFWKYWVAAGFMYCVERLVRGLRARLDTRVIKVVQHPGKVVECQIKKKWCRTRPGQYIFLNCPELGRFEWHPFTLTSAPEESFISVHTRVAGDWTARFAERLGCRWDKEGEVAEPRMGEAAVKHLPRVMVDGPYGASSEDVFNYEISVCIGAGIGFTPFASVLKSLWYKILNPASNIALVKAYFIWICRDKDAFQWFQDLLIALEAENIDEYLELSIYYTGHLKEEEISNIVLNQAPDMDALTGLRSATHYGRPNLDQIFKRINSKHPNTDVGVFFCGPKALNKSIHRACNKYTSVDEEGTRFYYHKENF